MRNLLAVLGGSSGAFGAAAVVLVVVAGGYWFQTQRAGDPPAPEQAAVIPQQDDNAQPVTEPDTGDAPDVPATAAPQPVSEAPDEAPGAVETADSAPIAAPAFDEVRREPDGMTVIAGRAAPGADVQVLQNGKEIGRVTADGSGKFATLAMIPPDGKGHVLSLLQRIGAAEVASESEIILAPLAPLEVAVAEDAPAPSVPASQPDPAAKQSGAAQDAEPADAGSQTSLAEDEASAQEADIAATDAPAVSQAEGVQTALSDEDQVPSADQVAAAETPAEPALPAVPQQSVTSPQIPAGAGTAASITPEQTESATATGTGAPEAPLAPAPGETPVQSTVVAVLKSTPDGVELLNTPSPEVMENVAIDTISYSDVGEVQLAGRAQSQATSVRVYLDNTSVVNLPVDDQGRWRGELPDVDEGIYTLRVDEVAANGAVTSRVETPFKREAAEVLAAAAAGQDGPLRAITVQRGATLWAIARDRYGDGALYVRVFEANAANIRDPDLIYPGQIFDLPD